MLNWIRLYAKVKLMFLFSVTMNKKLKNSVHFAQLPLSMKHVKASDCYIAVCFNS